ncbi:MAG: NifU N-terminal domain-containing protein [Chloroflexi bacterium]|nr:NifU N-terminal domain-containing protein [Chloroflexota bacterium]MCI0644528.1 NifU N-terminal domain-containing protein [Chloroflexota bacterium]MCI0728783.1 NifU N-terminal domain-containing protein [Chloroflexota bacterium]
MSEYIEIQTDPTDDPDVFRFHTNLLLVEAGVEEYDSAAAMEEGSPVAQALAAVEGLAHLRLETHDLLITRDPAVPWHAIIADVTAAIKDFFL